MTLFSIGMEPQQVDEINKYHSLAGSPLPAHVVDSMQTDWYKKGLAIQKSAIEEYQDLTTLGTPIQCDLPEHTRRLEAAARDMQICNTHRIAWDQHVMYLGAQLKSALHHGKSWQEAAGKAITSRNDYMVAMIAHLAAMAADAEAGVSDATAARQAVKTL